MSYTIVSVDKSRTVTQSAINNRETWRAADGKVLFEVSLDGTKLHLGASLTVKDIPSLMAAFDQFAAVRKFSDIDVPMYSNREPEFLRFLAGLVEHAVTANREFRDPSFSLKAADVATSANGIRAVADVVEIKERAKAAELQNEIHAMSRDLRSWTPGGFSVGGSKSLAAHLVKSGWVKPTNG